MDQSNENFYKNLVFAMPFLVVGFFLSIIFNYITLQAGANNNVFKYTGWPFESGEVIADQVNIHFIGFSGNVVVWTVIIALAVMALIKIFVKKQ